MLGSNLVWTLLVLLIPITRNPVISSSMSDAATWATISKLRRPKRR